MTRKCRVCQQVKPITKFPKTNSYIRADGSKINWYKHTCRKCMRG